MKNLRLIPFLLTLFFCTTFYGQKKDSLFIKYDKTRLSKEKIIGKGGFMYRINGTGNNGFVYFLEKEKYSNLKKNGVCTMKSILKKAKAYSIKNKIDDWKLFDYLKNNIVFLVKNKQVIKVEVWYEIE